MTIGELLYQCDIGYRNTFRKYERLGKKIIESNWSRNFNEICFKKSMANLYKSLAERSWLRPVGF